MTNKISGKLTVLVLVLALGFAPTFSYAKDNGNKKERVHGDQEKNERVEKVEQNNKSCLKAFGHLFARGFLKTHGEVNLIGHCFLPFGIHKKFHGTATSTSDIIPPTISRIRTLISTSTINVRWKTNENATSRVYYGASASLDINATTTSFVENGALKKNHALIVSNLTSSTTYYLAIESKDLSGNRTVTPAFTAMTEGL